jgi:hypothetical protein
MDDGYYDVLLREWLREGITSSSSERFPRDFGKYRRVVNSYEEFKESWEKARKDVECWSGVYSFPQVSTYRFDTVLIDLDYRVEEVGGGLDGSYFEKVCRYTFDAVSMLREIFPSVRVYYTGGYGMHVYLDFGREIQVFNWKKVIGKVLDGEANLLIKREYEDLVRVMKSLKKYVDWGALGAARRMARIVGSYGKAGYEMVRLSTWADDYMDWVFHIKHGFSYVPDEVGCDGDCDWFIDVVLDKDHRCSIDAVARVNRLFVSEILNKDSLLPPCIVRCVESLVDTGELDHGGRIHLASYLIQAGYSDDEIVQIFRAAKDFNEKYTRYQVRYLRENGYNPYKCRNVMIMGLCPFRCSYYPWIMKGGENEAGK